MREIKFRGKTIKDGSWIYGYLVMLCEETCPALAIGNDSFHLKGVKPETVGQYTGLKDKNGKEIYEGDILKDSEGDIGVCVFRAKDNLAEYFIADPNTNFEDGWYFWDSEPIEAIGNIHENLDLL